MKQRRAFLREPVTIRDATQNDIGAISEIYAHHVRFGLASFEEVPPSMDEMVHRFRDIKAQKLPYLAAEAGGRALGYAYAALYRTRSGYRYTLEDSVYLHPDVTGLGIGGMLLSPLIAACEERGYRRMIAVIGDRANLASIRLHERLGFTQAGLLPAVGFKFGRWVDSILMQRPLWVSRCELAGEPRMTADALVPVLVAAILAGEWPANIALAGILLVSSGILLLAKGWTRITSKTGIAAALLTGVPIAAYTVTDGLGARAAGNAGSYTDWLLFLDGLPMAAIYCYVWPRGTLLLAFDSAALRAAAGGVASLVAYAAAIFAATIAHLSEVSALRETSVVFAALFGRLFFNETLSPAWLGSCAAVAAGAICLGGWA